MEQRFSLHPKQWEAFHTPATEVLYGGAAGGGKSYLMRVAAISWCLLIPGLQVYIFRRTYGELEKNHIVGPTGFVALLQEAVNRRKCRLNLTKNQISFSNGSKIHLCHCQYEKDMFSFQGAEIHVLIIDEATHFTDEMYTYLRGRVRLVGLKTKIPPEWKDKFPKVLLGSNPGGIGHNYFKRAFVTARPPMEIEQMSEEEGGMLRQYIPALITDNQTLLREDPLYISRLKGLGNKALVQAMLDGNWNIVAGGAFDDVWEAEDHILKPFSIPPAWYVDRGFDWGSARPFSVLWFAEADGTEVPDGFYKGWCPPRETIIVIGEWYGCSGIPNKGLRMSAKEIALGVKEKEDYFTTNILQPTVINGRRTMKTIHDGPADNQIFSESNENCIADDMGAEGIYWDKSNKSAGTRVSGLEIIRARLKNGIQAYVESPALYIFNTCPQLIDHLPVLPRDKKKPEDVDSEAEDHDYDVLRYRCLGTEQRPLNFKVRMF